MTQRLTRGDTRAALAVVPVGRDRRIRLHTSAAALHARVEVLGYYAYDGIAGLHPEAPVRVASTRSSIGRRAAGPLLPGESVDVPLAERDDVPARPVAALLTATASRPESRGRLRIGDVAVVRLPRARVRANGTLGALRSNGTVRMSASSRMHATLDLAGWFAR